MNQALIALAMVLSAFQVAAKSEIKPELTVTNPPTVAGIHIGDVLTRTFEIQVSQPYHLTDATLPKKNIRRNGMELVDLKVETITQSDSIKYVIRMKYQIFAISSAPTIMQLPAEKIAFDAAPTAGASVTLNVAAWPFWFSPLVIGESDTAKKNLLPDVPTPIIDKTNHQTRLGAFLIMAIASVLGLIYMNADGQWLPFMGGAFARAHRQIKRLAKAQSSPSQTRETQAYVQLHQAFNQHFGANIFARDIETFLALHPRFNCAKKEIEAFFEASSRSLFGPTKENSHEAILKLVQLSRQLRDCERGVA